MTPRKEYAIRIDPGKVIKPLLVDTLPLGRKTKVVFGPPGTGKTWKLISEYVTEIKAGRSYDQIAYVSFSRRATSEARARAAQVLGIQTKALSWFRTLHSIAFEALAITPAQVLSASDISKIAKKCGIPLKPPPDHSWEITSEGADKYLYHEATCRLNGTDLKTYCDNLHADRDVDLAKLSTLARVLKTYKEVHGKYDFTDMIIQFVDRKLAAQFKVVIVDEAQDLTTFQWRMVRLLSNEADTVWIGGDDDQNIYEWAGANSQNMLDVANNGYSEVEVLPISYRVPFTVKELADTIINRVKSYRQPKSWESRAESGEVERVTELNLDALKRPGTHLYLARNDFFIGEALDTFITRGVPYYCASRSDWRIRPEVIRAYWSWRRLISGERIPLDSAVDLYACMEPGYAYYRGAKSDLEKQDLNSTFSLEELSKDFGLLVSKNENIRAVLTRLTETELAFLDSCDIRLPLLTVSTIHGAKGGEADHVYLDLRWTQRTSEMFDRDPDPEHRVWYVAVTRARQTLTLIYNGGPGTSYPL